jgi:hypothetical protein
MSPSLSWKIRDDRRPLRAPSSAFDAQPTDVYFQQQDSDEN